MMCNVYQWNHRSHRLGGNHIRMVPLIDFHVHVESLTKGSDFQVVSVGASSGHMLQVVFEYSSGFFRGRGGIIKRC